MRGSIEVTPGEGGGGGEVEGGTGNGADWVVLMEREGTVKPWGPVQAQSAGSWKGSARSGPKAKAQLGKRAQGLCGEPGLWGGGAAAGASPWVAGSIGNRLGNYVQRWAWARDVLLKAPPFHCDIIS